jgi:hypothetical protein
MKMLVDAFDFSESSTVQTLVTEEKGQKKYYIKGIFAQAETKNRNGRNYPRSAMERALNEYTKLIKAKRALGELNHPDHPNVNLERASHLIESLTWDGNNIIGKARVLTEMPMGKVAKGLLDEGVQLGVSTRGLGSLVQKNGVNVVQDDYVMTAVDIVGDPSAPDAFVEGIMEGAEWIYNASTKSWMLAEQIRSDIKKMSAKHVADSQARIFERFLNGLK